MTRHTDEHRVYAHALQHTGKQHRAVNTIQLLGLERVVDEPDPLREQRLSRQACVCERAVFETALLQRVPYRENLLFTLAGPPNW